MGSRTKLFLYEVVILFDNQLTIKEVVSDGFSLKESIDLSYYTEMYYHLKILSI